jgi:peptidoglycan/LPS O-acetylase OafA/YrhL
MSWTSWAGSAISNAFFVLGTLAILGVVLFRIAGPERRRLVMGLFALVVFAGMIASAVLLPGLLPAQQDAGSAILSLALVGGVAWTIVLQSSWRPAQWAAFGTGALIMASVIVYLSSPDFQSPVDPVTPPWTRAAWLALGYCSAFLGPGLLSEFSKPREPGAKGIWPPSRWSSNGISTLTLTIILVLLAVGDTTWLLAAFIAAFAIMTVEQLIRPILSLILIVPRLIGRQLMRARREQQGATDR